MYQHQAFGILAYHDKMHFQDKAHNSESHIFEVMPFLNYHFKVNRMVSHAVLLYYFYLNIKLKLKLRQKLKIFCIQQK